MKEYKIRIDDEEEEEEEEEERRRIAYEIRRTIWRVNLYLREVDRRIMELVPREEGNEEDMKKVKDSIQMLRSDHHAAWMLLHELLTAFGDEHSIVEATFREQIEGKSTDCNQKKIGLTMVKNEIVTYESMGIALTDCLENEVKATLSKLFCLSNQLYNMISEFFMETTRRDINQKELEEIKDSMHVLERGREYVIAKQEELRISFGFLEKPEAEQSKNAPIPGRETEGLSKFMTKMSKGRVKNEIRARIIKLNRWVRRLNERPYDPKIKPWHEKMLEGIEDWIDVWGNDSSVAKYKLNEMKCLYAEERADLACDTSATVNELKELYRLMLENREGEENEFLSPIEQKFCDVLLNETDNMKCKALIETIRGLLIGGREEMKRKRESYVSDFVFVNAKNRLRETEKDQKQLLNVQSDKICETSAEEDDMCTKDFGDGLMIMKFQESKKEPNKLLDVNFNRSCENRCREGKMHVGDLGDGSIKRSSKETKTDHKILLHESDEVWEKSAEDKTVVSDVGDMNVKKLKETGQKEILNVKLRESDLSDDKGKGKEKAVILGTRRLVEKEVGVKKLNTSSKTATQSEEVLDEEEEVFDDMQGEELIVRVAELEREKEALKNELEWATQKAEEEEEEFLQLKSEMHLMWGLIIEQQKRLDLREKQIKKRREEMSRIRKDFN